MYFKWSIFKVIMNWRRVSQFFKIQDWRSENWEDEETKWPALIEASDLFLLVIQSFIYIYF